ncbi:MAG: LCP family protein [Actinomycetota bacterium]|nr:LCP family protein [Actinomycetota bacterium]
MKNNKGYLKYLSIILSVIVIAVVAIIGINMRNNKKSDYTDTDDNIFAEESTTTIIEKKVDENFYSSSSAEFTNFSFISPKNWTLAEGKNSERILLTNNDNSANESIIISVEKLSENKDIEKEDEILSKYFSGLEKTEGKKDFPEEEIEISEIKSKIYGYEYDLLLEGKQKAVDLISFFKNDGCVYIFKYMGANVNIDTAITNFKSFLKSVSINSTEKNAKKLKKQDSVNILILGDDSAFDRPGGRVNGRTDIIMIFHINLEKQAGTIVTIPRDTWVNIPGHKEGKINGAHAIGGNELTVKTIEELSGLEIDNYVVTDFDGFKPLIDFLGGVTIEVNENLSDSFSGCYLNEGIHHLNGEQALALCRNRHRNGEPGQQGGAFAREREAAKVILALYDQQTTFDKFLKMPVFVNYILNYVWTDFTFVDIVKLLPSFGKLKMQNIKITTIPSWPQMVGDASAVVYDKEATKELFEEIKNQ